MFHPVRFWNLSSLILSPKFASVCLPNITQLFLSVDGIDLDSLCRFRRLYVKLESFELSVDRSSDMQEPAWIRQPSGLDTEVLPPDQVTSLMLEGDLNSVTTPQFISTFSSILHCSLNVDSGDLFAILENLSPRIRKLEITSGPETAPVDVLLLKLNELTSLSLYGDIYTQNLLPNLHLLPRLTSLWLAQDPDVTLDHVLLLLSGPTKIHSLKELELFGFSLYQCSSGSSYLDPHHRFHLDAGTIGRYAPVGWTLPEWSEEFPRTDVEIFLEVAALVGIEVGSHLQEAMQIEDAYVVEVEQCEIYSRTREGRARLRESEGLNARVDVGHSEQDASEGSDFGESE